MSLSKIMNKTLHCMHEDKSVLDAVKEMEVQKIGALVIGSTEKMVGIFSERDLLNRVVSRGKDPSKTKISDVMSTPVKSIAEETDPQEALRVMDSNGFRHLPVCNSDGVAVGMLSIRDLFHYVVRKQKEENEALLQFLSADGPGG